MTAFALVAATLVALGLAWLLRPLLARTRGGEVVRDASNLAVLRDQSRELDADLAAGLLTPDQHREARAELERRVLDEARGGDGPSRAHGAALHTAIVLAFCIPVAAALLYLQLGSRDAFDAAVTARGAADPQRPSEHEIEAMIAKLAARMQADPGDPQGWAILARSYYVTGRFNEAAEAYAKLAALTPDDAEILADYADALAMAQGRKIAGKPMELVRRALAIDPGQWKALALAGTDAFERQDYRAAVGYWERLRASVPPESELAQSIDSSLAEARQLGGLATASPRAPLDGRAAGRVAGTVALDAALAARADPDDTVFVYARAASGSSMPLAVLRKRVKDLPFAFALDDAMAMTPQTRLSTVTDVVVGARVSRSGQAAAQSGDLEGVSAPVKVGATGVAIVIDRALP